MKNNVTKKKEKRKKNNVASKLFHMKHGLHISARELESNTRVIRALDLNSSLELWLTECIPHWMACGEGGFVR